MNYKIILKQIQIIDINAPNKEVAINQIKNQILQQDPKALYEIQIAEEAKINE